MNLRDSREGSFAKKQKAKNNDYQDNLFSSIFLSPRKTNRGQNDKRRKMKKKRLKSEILYDRYIPCRKDCKLKVAYEKGG